MSVGPAGDPMPHIGVGPRALVTVAVMLATFVTALDTTVLSTAMPGIIADLGDLRLYGWVMVSYQLVLAVAIPVFGSLADLYGRRIVYITGASLFAAASALCGFASSALGLVLFRGLQGLGAGALVAVGRTIIGDLYPLQQLTKVNPLFTVMWPTAAVVGPFVGGVFADRFGWEWVFLANLPVTACVLAIVVWAFRESHSVRRGQAVDYAGMTLFVVGATTLLWALRDLRAGHGPLLLVLGAVTLAGFLAVEQRSAYPMLSPLLWHNRIFSIGALYVTFFAMIAMFGALYYVPLFVRVVMSTSSTVAGAVHIPVALAWAASSFVGNRALLRFRMRSIALLGLGMGFVGFAMIAGSHGSLTYDRLLWSLVFVGLGMGFGTSIFGTAVVRSVERSQRGVATAGFWFARSVGGAVGVAVIGAILFSRLSVRLGSAEAASQFLHGSSQGATLSVVAGALGPLAEAFQAVFWTSAALFLVAALGVAFLPGGLMREVEDGVR